MFLCYYLAIAHTFFLLLQPKSKPVTLNDKCMIFCYSSSSSSFPPSKRTRLPLLSLSHTHTKQHNSVFSSLPPPFPIYNPNPTSLVATHPSPTPLPLSLPPFPPPPATSPGQRPTNPSSSSSRPNADLTPSQITLYPTPPPPH